MYMKDKNRNENKDDIIFGTRAVIEAIRSGKEVNKVMVQKGLSNELFAELKEELKGTDIPFQFVPPEKLNYITRKNHQGVIAFVSPANYHKLENILPQLFEEGKNPLLLMLDRVTDVRNFGAICRSAECLGVHAVIIPSRGGAQITSDAVKTSAGALLRIPVCREENLKETIEYVSGSGLQIVSCTEKTTNTIDSVDLSQPTLIIMGSEEDGISGEYLKRSDHKVKIPMSGEIESLNVSVATGIILYEAVRQRLKSV